MLVQLVIILYPTRSTPCPRTPPSSYSTIPHRHTLQARLRRLATSRLRSSRLRGAVRCLCFARGCIYCASVVQRRCSLTRTGAIEGVYSTASVTMVKADLKSTRLLARKTSRCLGKDRGLEAYCVENEGALFFDYVCVPFSGDRKETELVLW